MHAGNLIAAVWKALPSIRSTVKFAMIGASKQSHAVIEELPGRMLLTSSYLVDPTGVSSIRLEHNPFAVYDIDVHLNGSATVTTTLSPDATTHRITITGR